ncbi:MAG: hypothetical protein LBD18_06975 [Treponema sp.]|jgi:hypothetical protein|nr:hypothetical protein [Treponema sp.]
MACYNLRPDCNGRLLRLRQSERRAKNKARNNKLILDNYNDDLSYNYNKPLYFMPLPVFQNWRYAFLSFNPSAEYNEDILEIFSSDYIRSNIHEVYCVFLKSEKIPFIIQFPNRKIFDKYLAKLEKKPMFTKNALKNYCNLNMR